MDQSQANFSIAKPTLSVYAPPRAISEENRSGPAGISADDLAQDVVRYLFKHKFGRDPQPEEFAFQKRFLLDQVLTIDGFDAALECEAECQVHRAATSGVTRPAMFSIDQCDFLIPSGSFLASALSHPRGYEWWALPAFLDLCLPGLTVVDIGANWGVYAIPAARRVGPRGKVFAFEAAPENGQMLMTNSIRNGVGNIELMNLALSDRFGMAALPMRRPQNSGCVLLDRIDANQQILDWNPVAMMPLDSMRRELGRVDLIKIDIDGADYRACLGAQRIIREDRPTIFIEFCPQLLSSISKINPDELLHFFIDLGYHIDVLHQERPVQRISGSRNDVVQGVMAHINSEMKHIDLRLNPRDLTSH